MYIKLSPVSLAIAMVVGVIITAQFGIFIAGIVALAMLAVFCLETFVGKSLNLTLCILAVALFVSGVSYTHSVNSHKSPEYINRYVTVRGTLISTATKSLSSDNYRYILRVRSITNKNGTAKTNENILLTTPKKFHCNTSVTVRGIIDELPAQMNDSGFDAAMYYKSNNIFTRIFSEDISRTQDIPPLSVFALGQMLSERVDAVIYKYYTGDGAAVLSAVLTGNKHHFSAEFDEILHRTGFMRLLHPAYVHILIILSAIAMLTRFVDKKYRDALAAAVFMVYALLQCSNIGFSRCMVCAALSIFYRYRYGTAYFPDTIATVVIFCMVTMPTILFNAAFVLSITGGLVAWAFTPHVAEHLTALPYALRRAVAVMIVFALIMTPIVSYFYNGLCIYSFFMPLVLAPVLITILICAPVTFGLCGLIGTAPIFGAYLNIAVRCIYGLPFVISSLPFSYISLTKPSITFVIMFVCVVLAAYYVINNRKAYAAVYASFSAGFCGALIVTALLRIGPVEVNFVNVGQGDGAVVHTPYRETVVIDAGGTNEWSDYDSGRALFLPYLEAMGINRIEAIIVSHYHSDHARGVVSLLDSIRTDDVFVPVITDADSEAMHKLAEEIQAAAERNGTELHYVARDTRLEFRDGLVVDIYAPSEFVRLSDENNTTMPVRVGFGEFSVLFTGDMTDVGERAFISRREAESDILKVSHHGSQSSTCDEFVEAVAPKHAVISCGEGNSYGHPHPETLDALADATVLRTDLLGDIRVSARKNGEYKIKK